MSRLFRTSVAALAAVMLFTVSAARAGVLDQVPGEALFVVKVTNLKSTSEKFARFATDLGVAAMVPPLQDPLGALQQQIGIANGLNETGDLAFAFIDPAAVGEAGPDESILVLIPVSDYDAFVKNFADAKTEGEITEFTTPNSGAPSYVMKWGDYAALTPAKGVLAIKPTGVKVSGVAAKETQKDLVFYANMPNIRAKLQPELAKGRENILSEMEGELQNEPELAKFAPVLKALVGRLLDVADTFLRDANAATVAINFVPEGLNASVVAEFEQGSYLGKFVGGTKNTTESFTKHLPAGKYMLFGGSTGDPEQTVALLNDLAGPVLAELKNVGGEQAAEIDKMYSHLLAYVKAAKGQTFGVTAPQGEFGSSALIQGFSVYQGDASAMKKAYLDMTAGQETLMTAFGLPAEQFKYTLTPNAKTVSGVSFDEVVSSMKFDPNDPAAAQAEQMMKFLYGPDGMKFHIGVLDNDTLVQGFGLNDQQLGEVIAAAKSGADPMGGLPGVKAVNAQLPSSRVAAIYVPVDEVVNTGLNVAKQFGFGVNVQMQPDLPPIGASVASDGTALRIDAHAPTQLISQLIAAGFQIGMQMNQGGGQNRGPGGL